MNKLRAVVAGILALSAAFGTNAGCVGARPLETPSALEFRKNLKFILDRPWDQVGAAREGIPTDRDWILLLEKMPWVWRLYQSVPWEFSLAKQDIIWAPDQIVVQNVWVPSPIEASPLDRLSKTSRILFSFGDTGGSFNSQLEIPLLYSASGGIWSWRKVPPGYYAFRLRPGEYVEEKRFNLKFETRF